MRRGRGRRSPRPGRAGLRRDRRIAAAYGDGYLRSKRPKSLEIRCGSTVHTACVHATRTLIARWHRTTDPPVWSSLRAPPGFVRGMRGPRQNHALKNRLYQALLQLLSCAAKCIHTRHSELPVAIEQKSQPGQSAKAARGAESGNGGASATHPHDADSDQDAVGAPAGEQHARGSNPSRTHELQT